MTKDLPPSNLRPPELSGDSHRGADGGFFVPVNNKAIPLPMEMIREALELDPTSPSYLRWKIRPRHHFDSDRGWRIRNARDAGQVAGWESTAGCGKEYYKIGLGGSNYNVHRIVYFLANGIDPGSLHIDHIDGDGANNNPTNLRLASHAENLRNRGVQQNNTSGYKGVTWHKQSRKWHAKLRINGCQKHLGLFTDLNAAAAAYEAAARQHHKEFFHQPQNINPQ